MGDSEAPVVAATRVSQIEGVVTGVAVGVPVERQPSEHAADTSLSDLASSLSVAPPVVADAVLYSPLQAKMFARYDLDKNGSIDREELRKMLQDLNLPIDTDALMATFGERSQRDGKITLSDWEKGLDDRMRKAIEAKLDEEMEPSSASK